VGGGLIAWVTGLNLNKGQSYECTVRFPEACSITVGTPVRVCTSPPTGPPEPGLCGLRSPLTLGGLSPEPRPRAH